MATTDSMILLIVPAPVRGQLLSIDGFNRGFRPMQSLLRGAAFTTFLDRRR